MQTTPITPQASIDLEETIPVILTPTDPMTGQPIPGATVSNVVFNQSTPIGAFLPTSNPNIFTFKPSTTGTMSWTATGLINIP